MTNAGIGSARLDALILLEDELGKDRSWILAHPETALQGQTLQRLNKLLGRRVRHEPMAYIRGFSEFYGRRFFVNKNVLEPRPESETMIECLLELNLPSKSRVVDIGTGSGALVITAKLELPPIEAVATEIDVNALKVAHQNAKELGADIKLLQGDLLRPLLTTSYYPPTTILANLPYVPDHWKINEAAAMEPKVAIFGGPDGLDLYRRLFEQINSAKLKPAFVLTEALPPQHKRLAQLAGLTDYEQIDRQDFIQVFRHTPIDLVVKRQA